MNINTVFPIIEYLPSWKLGGLMILFYLTALTVLGMCLHLWVMKYADWQWTLPVFLFLILGFFYNRVIPYSMVLSVIFLTQRIDAYWQKYLQRYLPRVEPREGIVKLIFASIVILFPLLGTGHTRFLAPDYAFGLGTDPVSLPVKATEFLKENPIPGRMYNHYFFGGYLLWNLHPNNPVFVDGRIPAYPADFLKIFRRSRFEPVAFKQLDSTYSFQYLVLNHDTFRWKLSAVYPDSTWIPVFWNRAGHRILIRNTGQNAGYIKKFGYREYTYPQEPQTFFSYLSNPEDSSLVVDEIIRHYHWSPDSHDITLLKSIGLRSDGSRIGAH